MATVLAGPGVGPVPGRFRGRCGQGREPDRGRHPAHGLGRSPRRRVLHVEAARPGQAGRGARPEVRRRPRRRCASCSTPPTCSSRTSGPARSSGWASDPTTLLERNPGLVILRITGFGQDGPYAGRPGFATMAEAMSGFAAINGEPDGAPLLPPIALTDEVTALAGAFTVMVALRHRDRTGEGQVVDINLLETMLQLMGALPSANAHLGYLQPRLGSGIPYTVPRGTYQCADGEWIAISTSAESHRGPGDGAARRGRRPTLRDLRGPGRAPDRARRDRRRVGRRPAVRRGARRVRGRRTPRSRPSIRWPTCSPIRTSRRGRRSSRSTGCGCRACWRGSPRRRATVRHAGPARSVPTPTR